MTQRQGKLHLNAFLMNVGHHEAAWRLPESDAFANTNVKHYQELARTAERGKLDSLFLADSPVLWTNIGQRPGGSLEPTVLLTALAGVTEHIGLIATASTTYNEPYNLARRFASLDHISGGRAGWNIVTTAGVDAARNFNLTAQPAHADRYARAAEFVDVSLKLWDSWDDEAPLGDKEQGVWGDDAKLYPPRHVGRGLARLRRLPEGIAGDAALTPAQRRDALDLHLPVRHARQFRGGGACRPDHRRGRHRAGDPHGTLFRHGTDAGSHAAGLTTLL